MAQRSSLLKLKLVGIRGALLSLIVFLFLSFCEHYKLFLTYVVSRVRVDFYAVIRVSL